MIALLQRVREASVTVGERTVGSIGGGMLVFLAVLAEDGPAQADRMAERIATWRLFPDDSGRPGRSAEEAGDAAVLVVSQFTLGADTRKGRRPDYGPTAPPEQARELYERVIAALRARGLRVETGEFGAHMDVRLWNDGPVTFRLEA